MLFTMTAIEVVCGILVAAFGDDLLSLLASRLFAILCVVWAILYHGPWHGTLRKQASGKCDGIRRGHNQVKRFVEGLLGNEDM
jgi:uncharacterized membrane protein YphA (DoxX/SURF4 family)